jgi:SAM-dependent methyltransferase
MFRRRDRATSAAPAAVPTPAPDPAPTAPTTPTAPTILDQYVRSAPTPQHAIDIFAGEWSSALPAHLGVTAGAAALFDDGRISWLIDHLGGVADQRVLELGPLEGGHSAMLHEAGAEVVAVEGSTRAYLKCLIAKELLSLHRCNFLLGDFLEYLHTTDERFDLVLASGVLYHAPDPIALLEAIAAVTDRVAIWTHYFDPDVIGADPAKARLFQNAPEGVDWRGHRLHLHRRAYLEALQWGGFCGGPETSALWMERDGLMLVLTELGFRRLDVHNDDPHHPNGPCVMLCAQR